MPPTRRTTEGDEVCLAFNVMQGPGQMPLDVGLWRLVAGIGRRGRGERVAVRVPPALDAFRETRVFSIRKIEYRVETSVEPTPHGLALDVMVRQSRAPVASDAAARGPVERRVRRFAHALRGWLFDGAYRACRVVARRDPRRVLFTSDSHAVLQDNLAIVHDRMVERGLDRDFQLQTLLRPAILARRSFRDRMRLPWLLATVGVIVLDDFEPIIYRVRDRSARIIQLWHASGAFKTVGYSRVGKPGGPDPYSGAHKNYTHAIVSSDHDVPYYAEAFGIPEDRVVPTGIPRMDRFFDPQRRAAGRAAALEAFPQARGRRTILFAPTFRGKGPSEATYDLEELDYESLHALCVEKDAVVILKMHPFVHRRLGIPPAFRDRLLDGAAAPAIDVNDLLFAVDLLVTDYSSIVFEYSILGRPMLFFAYDLDDYIASRDFYVPYEQFVPGRIVRTFDQLIDAIRRDDYQFEKVADFARRHFAHLDAGSADRVIDQLIARR
jgi:CDP-ribitol ribitolphosphotransferase / teichoic acid ribitol-phosphate polymerase